MSIKICFFIFSIFILTQLNAEDSINCKSVIYSEKPNHLYKYSNTSTITTTRIILKEGNFLLDEICESEKDKIFNSDNVTVLGRNYSRILDVKNINTNIYSNSKNDVAILNIKNKKNIFIHGVNFKNVKVSLTNSNFIKFFKVGFINAHHIEPDLKTKNAHFLSVVRSNFITVSKSFFYRNSDYYLGKGITIYDSNDFILSGTEFIGHFITAVNGGVGSSLNFNKNIEIKNNTITRSKIYPPIITKENSAFKNLEDHGIYIWGFDNLLIKSNIIKGWSPTDAGGAIKIRNGKNATVSYNTLNDSGIYLYAYFQPKGDFNLNPKLISKKEDVVSPLEFSNVKVHNNKITQSIDNNCLTYSKNFYSENNQIKYIKSDYVNNTKEIFYYKINLLNRLDKQVEGEIEIFGNTLINCNKQIPNVTRIKDSN